MDPDANLEELRRLVAQRHGGGLDEHDVLRLADLIESLDDWLSRGGFLPADWAKKRK